jgi:hypothetical protein
MPAQRVPVQRVKIWSIGFAVLFGLLVFLAAVFISHLSDWTLRFFFVPFNMDFNQLDYHVCAESGPQSFACQDIQGESIFLPQDGLLVSFYALGLLALTCLVGFFLTESKLMRLGVFPLQLLSVISAGILVISGTPLIINQAVYGAERMIRPLSFIMLGLNYFSLLLLSYRIMPWKRKWWSLFGVVPVLVGLATPVFLLLFRPSGWKWCPEAIALLILGEAGAFLIFGFAVDGELSTGLFISTYIILSLGFLLIVRTEQVMKREQRQAALVGQKA